MRRHTERVCRVGERDAEQMTKRFAWADTAMLKRRFHSVGLLAGVLLACALPGCVSVPSSPVPAEASIPELSAVLLPGDDLEIKFFGAPNLNTVQTIRRDGKISLELLGEMQAGGRTPGKLKQEIAQLAANQLQVKDVTVIVRSPASLFVGGAVRQPGRISLAHPLTVLQAIMLAGGFDQEQADVRNVVVIRYSGDRCSSWTFNLEDTLRGISGPDEQPFYVRPFDVIYVPRDSVL